MSARARAVGARREAMLRVIPVTQATWPQYQALRRLEDKLNGRILPSAHDFVNRQQDAMIEMLRKKVAAQQAVEKPKKKKRQTTRTTQRK